MQAEARGNMDADVTDDETTNTSQSVLHSYSRGDPPEPDIFGFDDLQTYLRVYYRGREGRIMAMGNNVTPSDEGRHIKIRFNNAEGNKSKTMNIHENNVNRYLNECRILWVDWDGHLSPYHNE